MSVDFATENLRIHPFAERDRAALGKILTDRQVARTYMLPDFETEEAVDRMFSRFLELSRRDDRYVAGIYRNETLVGFLNDVEV